MQPDHTQGVVLLYRISSVMEKLQVCRATVYRMVKRGELEMVHFGPKASRITAESVHRLISVGSNSNLLARK